MRNIKKFMFKLKMKWMLFKLRFKKIDYDENPPIYIYEEDEK